MSRNTMARNGDLRRAILDESRRLLLEQGYGHVSMRKVAAAVGCTATSIYLHFDSKDALIHALIEEGMDLLYADLEKAAATDGDVGARFEALCRAFLDFGLGNPEYYEIMFQLTPREMQRYPSEKYRRARRNLEFFASVLAEARAGESGFDPLLASTVLWSQLHGALSLLHARRVDARYDTPAFIDGIVDHALSLMQPTGSSSPS
ncbi:MAG: TetR/AcrR family transcriptional regulator [Planctomycetota bacterium]|jgi:AcrR family transcriptional regulator